MRRSLLWRLVGLLALYTAASALAWLLAGGPGRMLRGRGGPGVWLPSSGAALQVADALISALALAPAIALAVVVLCGGLAAAGARLRARARRRYARFRLELYRTDSASAEALVAMLMAIHKRMLRRWWRRLVSGQPGLALEVHHDGPGAARCAWLAVCCAEGSERLVEAALRTGYPNCRLRECERELERPVVVLRLKKQELFLKRVKLLDRYEHEREPPMNGLLTTIDACAERALVQLALTPAPASFERVARRMYRRHEKRLADRGGSSSRPAHSLLEQEELRGGLALQHSPLFFADLRIVASTRSACERIASELRARGAENRLVERGTGIRHGLLGLYAGRVRRGEGNMLPSLRRGVYAPGELAAIWHAPSIDYTTVPFARTAVPLAPAPPAILRLPAGEGSLEDAIGPVSIHPQLRKQNTAVPGAVEQGKTSYLVATVAEDLRRERCTVIVLDPKGDAAEAAVSLVPAERTCTLLDLAHPRCGFNPLAVQAPADVIADYVVAALKNLFTDADIRASSDRYLRNAIIAVLAFDRGATLWDAARLLSVGEEGYAYRRAVAARVRALPEFKEISDFFTSELSAQLADARSTTTSKLDAPVNKLARLLNSASIKRVLLNDSLRVDFDRVIAGCEVLVVKGALGTMGAGNTAVLLQLLVGMLDAALARQQDLVPPQHRVAVALKVDEAPLVLNRGFAETMALKRSAGLETVACWQADAQWTDREVRAQLDALFAHRVYFATASADDARAGVKLTMAQFSDAVRPGVAHLSALGQPDVRLHLPRHHAVVSWTTPAGRQRPFIACTLPLRIDRERFALHAARQQERGGRHLADLRQPHWLGKAVDEEWRGPVSPHARAAPIAAPIRASAARTGPAEPLGDRRTSGSHAGAASDASVAADSYAELVALDAAHSVRWGAPPKVRRNLSPDRLDLEVLSLVACLGHVLSSQLHRRFQPSRSPTTTQRRLKRLSDAGLLERFQFYRRDGGAVPMCCVITARGRQQLAAGSAPASGSAPQALGAHPRAEAALRAARRDVRVAGWLLALSTLLGHARCKPRGREEAVLSPPMRGSSHGGRPLAPADLRLPGGQVPHDFLRTVAADRVEAERFESVRPDGILEVAPPAPRDAGEDAGDPSRTSGAIDVLVELDSGGPPGRAVAKLERYDHFLTGWSLELSRYGRRALATPLVVFVCRGAVRARELARIADRALVACRAYAGEYPQNWRYGARERVLFACERDVHEGALRGYGVPPLPPEVRIVAAQGDPRAGEARIESRALRL